MNRFQLPIVFRSAMLTFALQHSIKARRRQHSFCISKEGKEEGGLPCLLSSSLAAHDLQQQLQQEQEQHQHGRTSLLHQQTSVASLASHLPPCSTQADLEGWQAATSSMVTWHKQQHAVAVVASFGRGGDDQGSWRT